MRRHETDGPSGDHPHDFTRRTEGGEQAGNEHVGVEDDPQRLRACRVAAISASMSSAEMASVPAATERRCM